MNIEYKIQSQETPEFKKVIAQGTDKRTGERRRFESILLSINYDTSTSEKCLERLLLDIPLLRDELPFLGDLKPTSTTNILIPYES